ncbi:sugar kinase [Posidoniimonas corsicana]|uniref:sugar kinase n=1 Tax=Posidoniimonas corsicana TaxID=1938618 RepID=UPI001E628B9A|nr:sugar kinase [Posidoniimonas corsicana]
MSVRTDDCELDFVSLGALVHRLDPGITPFRKATNFAVHVSGGEYNCAANLASCFGLNTGIVTAMVDNGVGELIQTQVRQMGVKPFYKHFQHDGVRGPNMAAVYSDRGHGARAPVVFYNRANEAAAMLKPGDIDWKNVFDRGVRWFHSGGIYAALGEHTSDLIVEGVTKAKEAGAIASFDLNYRAKLWKTLPGGEAHGIEMNREIAKHLDVLIGNEEDLQKGLGLKGQDVEKKGKLDPNAFFGMIEQVKAEYPNIKMVATTLREVHSTSRHSWSAVLWLDGERYTCPTMELDVIDRIGGGDGFASGLIYGMLSGQEPEQALRLGWAHGALLTTYPGDVSQATLAEVEALAEGGSARVQR